MKNFWRLYFPVIVSAFVVSACGGVGRSLVIKSEPADADVCIKGKSSSEYFSNQKSCVGTTPYEAEKVDVMDPNGDEKHTVHFKDVDKKKESFYVVVSRQGYASQALEVPAWEHMVVLKPEGAGAVAAATPPVVATLVGGIVHITSEPVGALVYIEGQLKGNTPYTHEGAAGTVRLKLELEGYAPLEKALSIEPKGNLSVNFKMSGAAKSGEGAAVAAPSPAPAPPPVPASTVPAGTPPAPALVSAPPPVAPPAPPLQAEPMTAAPTLDDTKK